jgi:hypothetical protein
VFLSDHSLDALISCEALTNTLRVKTDHIPILTKLDLTVTRTPTKSTENFRNIDWDKFRVALGAHLTQLGLPATINCQQKLDKECEKLTKALKEAIREQVPTSEIGPRSKHWWTKELTNLRRQANKLGQISSKRKNNLEDPIHMEFSNAKRRYEKEIEYCKRHDWHDWLEKADDPDIWTAHRYVSAASSAKRHFNLKVS